MRSPTLAATAMLLSLSACDAKDAPPAAETTGAKDAASSGAPADEVDLHAAQEAFGCADDPSKRACNGLETFRNGQAVKSFPSEGTNLYLARSACTKDPHGMINFAIATLSAGGGIEHQFEAWPKERDKELAAARIMGDLERGGEPSEPSPEESADGYAPRTLAKMKDAWAMVPPVKLQTTPVGKSLREAPERPAAGEAYWREAGGKLVRVAPPSGTFGWCVNVYYPVPG